MVCIYCSSPLEVVNSRQQQRSNQVWRRRHCPNCDALFTTHESIDLSKALVVQYADKSLLPFMREKLLMSIYKSCQHRNSPIDDAAALAETITKKIMSLAKSGGIGNEDIARACLETLKNFDNPAAVQYEAFHAKALRD